MQYDLIMLDRDGGEHVIHYDNSTSALTHASGEPVIANLANQEWPTDFTRVSPVEPARKSRNVVRLRIQLGLKCNMHCSYCLQHHERPFAVKTDIEDAKAFIANLDGWLVGSPEKIEFWGGEPMLYWPTIKYLVEQLHIKFPNAFYVMVMNGTLLTDEVIDYAERFNIAIAISHDGPGQHLRGNDPLDDPEMVDRIKRLFTRRRGYVSFNPVIHSGNYDILAMLDWFKERFGNDVNVGCEDVVTMHGDGDIWEKGALTDKQLVDLQQNVMMAVIDGRGLQIGTFARTIDHLLRSIRFGRPSAAMHQACGMDRENHIAIDLKGNILSCNGAGALGQHYAGNISDMDAVRIKECWHWSYREECASCPVLQLCAGSCMCQEGANFYHSCNAHFHYYLGLMGGALYLLTGWVLKEVRGEILRPDPKICDEPDSKYRADMIARIYGKTAA
jgi:uncharacterized protein